MLFGLTRNHINKYLLTEIKMFSVDMTHMTPQVLKRQHFATSCLGKTSTVEPCSTVAIY